MESYFLLQFLSPQMPQVLMFKCLEPVPNFSCLLKTLYFFKEVQILMNHKKKRISSLPLRTMKIPYIKKLKIDSYEHI